MCILRILVARHNNDDGDCWTYEVKPEFLDAYISGTRYEKQTKYKEHAESNRQGHKLVYSKYGKRSP